MSDDIAISVKNVSKAYRIWRDPSARLKAPLWDLIGKVLPAWLLNLNFNIKLRAGNPERYYKDFYALKDVSFEVKKGEAVGIIGRNGSGKSTLLQLIAGTLTPTSGSIQVNGRVAALLELGSGFNPDFTGRENVYLNASVLGLTKDEIDARFNEIAAFADIGDFIEQPVKTYSSGMTMRLAFAVIAHVDANVLIVDEALAVGDAAFGQKCMRFMRRFGESGTLLIVSHDSGAILNLCNSAFWLKNGEIAMAGDTEKTIQEYLRSTVNETFKETIHAEKIEPQKCAVISHGELGSDTKVVFFEQIEKSDGWKSGKAELISIRLLDLDGNLQQSAIGGESLVVELTAVANEIIASPILGWFIKDRLGQSLFGEHTYTYAPPVVLRPRQKFKAQFTFKLPLLPNGSYFMTASIAAGTPFDAIQHHYIHDAVGFKVSSTKLRYGIVGITFESVKIQTIE